MKVIYIHKIAHNFLTGIFANDFRKCNSWATFAQGAFLTLIVNYGTYGPHGNKSLDTGLLFFVLSHSSAFTSTGPLSHSYT